MNPEERRPSSSLPGVAEGANGNRNNGDDEFGDFEESEEILIGNVPAASAGPSPWATFPDLLPVQTSPANTNDEVASSSQAADQLSQPWLVNMAGAASNVASGSGISVQAPSCAASSFSAATCTSRTGNPPDISIVSACGVSSSSSNFNGLDPVSGDPLQPSIVSSSAATGRHQFESAALVSELRQQIDALASQRSHLEQQLAWVSRENDRLSGELSSSNQRTSALQAQLDGILAVEQRERNNHCAQPSANLNGGGSTAIVQIQQTLTEIQNSQLEDRENLNQLRNNFESLATTMESRVQNLSDNLSKNCSDILERFSRSTVEMQTKMESVLGNCATKQSEAVAASISETFKKESVGQQSVQNDEVMAQFKVDLESFVRQNRQVLERERRNHLISLSNALKSALAELSSSLNNSIEVTQPEDHKVPGKS